MVVSNGSRVFTLLLVLTILLACGKDTSGPAGPCEKIVTVEFFAGKDSGQGGYDLDWLTAIYQDENYGLPFWSKEGYLGPCYQHYTVGETPPGSHRWWARLDVDGLMELPEELREVRILVGYQCYQEWVTLADSTVHTDGLLEVTWVSP